MLVHTHDHRLSGGQRYRLRQSPPRLRRRWECLPQLGRSDLQKQSYVRRHDVVSGWSVAAEVDSGSEADVSSALAVSANGSAIVVYDQLGNGSNDLIYANYYTAGVGWASQPFFLGGDGEAATQPDVAIDNDGNAIAVWLQSDGFGYNIFGARYLAATATWSTLARIEQDNAGNPNHPRISLDPSGNAFVIWERSDGVVTNVWADRF